MASRRDSRSTDRAAGPPDSARETIGSGLYSDRAGLYDLIYHWKSYESEVERLVEILAREGVRPGARVLDAACGTGEHLRHLAGRFEVTGLDRSEDMLAIVREKLPHVPRLQADLESFRVDEPFDAILCLFSSIGYVHGEERLRRVAASFARAVVPGGAIVVEPWLAPDQYTAGNVFLHTYESDDVKIARTSYSGARGDVSVIDFRWTIARRGKGLDTFDERHELWMCPQDSTVRIFAEAGFEVRFQDEGLMSGRGLLVGRRVQV